MTKILNETAPDVMLAVDPTADGILGAPITGDPVAAPMPAWSLPAGASSKGHPRAKMGYLPRGTEPTDHNLAVFFPEAVLVVKRPTKERDDIYVGSDGRSGIEVWDQYIKELSATQIGLDAQNAGLVTTAAMAEGKGSGKGQGSRCAACQRRGTTLMDGKCLGGCA